MDKEFLTVEDVAKLLQMKTRRIYEAINRGDLRAFRVSTSPNGPFRIKRADVNAWLGRMATRDAVDGEEEEILRVG